MAELFMLETPTPVIAKPGEWATNHYCRRTVGEWETVWEVPAGKWQALFESGALSFDPTSHQIIDPAEYAELHFLNQLVSAGLTPQQICSITQHLPRPLAYQAGRMTYSFDTGEWERMREPSKEELYEHAVEALAGEADSDRLAALGRRCFDRLQELVDELESELIAIDNSIER